MRDRRVARRLPIALPHHLPGGIPMDIAFVLYPDMTALDLVGPYDVLGHGPEVSRTSSRRPLTPCAPTRTPAVLDHYVRRPRPRGRDRRARRQAVRRAGRGNRCRVAAEGPPDRDLDDVGVHRGDAARRRGYPGGPPRHHALGAAGTPRLAKGSR